MRRATDLPLSKLLALIVAAALCGCSDDEPEGSSPTSTGSSKITSATDDATVEDVIAAGAAGAAGALPPAPTSNASPPVALGRIGAERCSGSTYAGNPLPPSPTITKVLPPPAGIAGAASWEGAVWVGSSLYWSEIGNAAVPGSARIHRFTPSSQSFTPGLVQNTGSNGLAVDAQGDLVAATHDSGGISTFSLATGARGQYGGPIAQSFNGQRFIAPNDLVIRSDGNLYFTDPRFLGSSSSAAQGSVTRVYRITPESEVLVVDDTLTNPNGITLSPDGSTLYVSSSSGTGLRSYALDASGAPAAGVDVPLKPPLENPDGMAIDCAGNVYATEHNARRITVLTAQGELIGSFGGSAVFDSNITNLAFGGADGRTLFVTTVIQGTHGGLYAVQLNTPGLPY